MPGGLRMAKHLCPLLRPPAGGSRVIEMDVRDKDMAHPGFIQPQPANA